jgi:16S rRNA (adenine1518-N6/adenine1519-N6)-dimethyltransferase
MKRNRTRTGSARTHALGQNFLVDIDVAMNIIAAAAITPDENILEVGPGQGMRSYQQLQVDY